MSQKGVEQTKDVVKMLVSAVNCAIHVSRDGQVSLDDIPAIWDVVVSIGPALQGLDQVTGEIGDLESWEFEELTQELKELVSTTNGQMKLIIEKSIVSAKALYDLYLAVRSK